jgi:hypothetical protein
MLYDKRKELFKIIWLYRVITFHMQSVLKIKVRKCPIWPQNAHFWEKQVLFGTPCCEYGTWSIVLKYTVYLRIASSFNYSNKISVTMTTSLSLTVQPYINPQQKVVWPNSAKMDRRYVACLLSLCYYFIKYGEIMEISCYLRAIYMVVFPKQNSV